MPLESFAGEESQIAINVGPGCYGGIGLNCGGGGGIGGAPASAPVGRSGAPLNVSPGTNAPATIGGRNFTGHAIDRMQGRGIPPSAVDNTIRNGIPSAGRGGATIYRTNELKVIVNPNGSVKTVIPQ